MSRRCSAADGFAVKNAATSCYDWNPEIIIAEQRAFTTRCAATELGGASRRCATSGSISTPAYPFGWIDDPAGVNRLIGLYWLSSLFYPDANQEDLRVAVCEFYDKFYRIKLTNAQIEAMVRPAGAPAVESSHGATEPLLGAGSIPLPSTPPANPSTPSATVSPLSPVTPSAPEATAPSTTPNASGGLPALPPMPSTASATCTLPGANGPLASDAEHALAGSRPAGRRPAGPARRSAGARPPRHRAAKGSIAR